MTEVLVDVEIVVVIVVVFDQSLRLSEGWNLDEVILEVLTQVVWKVH